MRSTVNARIPPRVEQKLAEYTTRRGVTRSQAVVRALDRFLDREMGGRDAYSLAADLIPAEGIARIQADRVRERARRARLLRIEPVSDYALLARTIGRYAGLPCDDADATLIALAERTGVRAIAIIDLSSAGTG
jgi:predicted nucleic acid-binding protein